jgi:RNA polymerase sigma factor (sigma-70 family)
VDEASVDLVTRWRSGDQQAADALFHRYAERLVALARKQLSGKMALRADPEDVVQSAYRSFFVNARAGQYRIEHAGDLWRLLAGITLHKAFHQIERHSAGKRSVHLEVAGSAIDVSVDALAREPSPEEAAALADELRQVMGRLEPLYRRVLELRLQGYSVEEISTQVQRGISTVKRALRQARHHIEQQRGGEGATE